jgi:3-deoxy-D-manno-octulosonic-acid transferase
MDIPKLFDDGFIFIVGSIWPQDAKHVLPAVAKVLNEFSNFRCILAPHEPNEYALEMLEDHFIGKKFSTIRLSQIKITPVRERIILIDRIGILAELYHQARLAFVGGGFRNSVHNVMEPAVAGLPILFGPNYHNSREAELLVESGGGFSCSDERHIYKIIKNLIKNSDAYEKASHSSRKIIMDNMGASARTVKEILENE